MGEGEGKPKLGYDQPYYTYLGVNRLGMLNGRMRREPISEGRAKQQPSLTLRDVGGHGSAGGQPSGTIFSARRLSACTPLTVTFFHKLSIEIHTSRSALAPPPFFAKLSFL